MKYWTEYDDMFSADGTGCPPCQSLGVHQMKLYSMGPIKVGAETLSRDDIIFA